MSIGSHGRAEERTARPLTVGRSAGALLSRLSPISGAARRLRNAGHTDPWRHPAPSAGADARPTHRRTVDTEPPSVTTRAGWYRPSSTPRGEPHEDLRRPLDLRLPEGAALVSGLIRHGIIDCHPTHNGAHSTLQCRRLPAAWLLRAPRYAVPSTRSTNPETPAHWHSWASPSPSPSPIPIAIPIAIGADPGAWTRWLADTP